MKRFENIDDLKPGVFVLWRELTGIVKNIFRIEENQDREEDMEAISFFDSGERGSWYLREILDTKGSVLYILEADEILRFLLKHKGELNYVEEIS